MTIFQVRCLETNKVYMWSILDVLYEINRDRSEDWTDYTAEDWREGWSEWVEGYLYTMQSGGAS